MGPCPTAFPDGFFDRADPAPDPAFYEPTRLVTHIDDRAIAAVGALYDELGLDGDVLDLMVVVGVALPARARATHRARHERRPSSPPTRRPTTVVVHDLNADPRLPFADDSFDGAVVLRVGRLPRPTDRGVRRRRPRRAAGRRVRVHVLEPVLPDEGDPGLAGHDDEQHCAIVAEYFGLAGGWDEPVAELRTPPAEPGDPLYAVWARRAMMGP